MSQQSTPTLDVDIAIVGAGMAGATMAVGLGVGGLRVAIIDRMGEAAMTDMRFDGRTAAIADAPKRMLEALGAWQAMAPHACPIDDIRISDGASPLFLHFDHRALSDEEHPAAPFGYIVENRHIQIGRASCRERV